MPTIVSQAQIQSVKNALGSVRSNSQAYAACAAVLNMAQTLSTQLRSVGGSIRAGAANDIDTYAARVSPFVSGFSGNPSGAVGPAWPQAYTQIFNLYMLAFTIESTMPPGTDLGDTWTAAIQYAISVLPVTISNAVGAAAGAVNDTIVAALWGFLKGAWPVLTIVGGGFVLLLIAKQKAMELPARRPAPAAPAPLQGARRRR
jgi:hypothetical protein